MNAAWNTPNPLHDITITNTKKRAEPINYAIRMAGAEVVTKWDGHIFEDDYISPVVWHDVYIPLIHQTKYFNDGERAEYMAWVVNKQEALDNVR